jgi:hypothetical protein
MKKYKKRIKWYTNKMSLQQAISSGVQMAFVSPDGEQCCPFVLCKDYLHDAVFNLLYKTKKKVWGFCYDPKKEKPIGLDAIRLLVTNSQDKKMREKVPAMIEFLNQIESDLKLKKTIVRECADPPLKYRRCGVYYLLGSKRWLKSPPMISLYTLLVRIGFSHEPGTAYMKTLEGIKNYKISAYQPEDRGRLNYALDGIKRIVKIGDRKIFFTDIKKNYPKGMHIKKMHDHMGIVAFSSGDTEKFVPKWHEDKE